MYLPRMLAPLTVAAVLVLAGLIGGVERARTAQAATTITVNTTANNGSCPGSSCSLRGAITLANADGSGDTIAFNIPASDPNCKGTPVICVFHPAAALPPLTADSTFINGYSQPGAKLNTQGIAGYGNPITGTTSPLGNNAVIKLQLDGATSAGVYGFDVSGSSNTIQGFSITGWSTAGIHLAKTAGGNKIQGNFLGPMPNGSNYTGNTYSNEDGINVDDSSSAALAAHAAQKVRPTAHSQRLRPDRSLPVHGTGAVRAPVSHVPAPAPRSALPVVGSTVPNIIGGIQDWQMNVISNNAADGIYVFNRTGTQISHNMIGTTRDGSNSLGNGEDGVYLEQDQKTTVGGSTISYRNLISGNFSYGIEDHNSDKTTIAADVVGADVSGRYAVGNENDGVFLDNTTNAVVGLPVTTASGAGRNTISGNYNAGLDIQFVDGLTMQNNFVGTDITGFNRVPNGLFGSDDPGVYLSNNYDDIHTSGQTRTIGGKTYGPLLFIDNVVSGTNEGDGIDSYYDFFDVFQGNRIGTNAAGKFAIPNERIGLFLGYTSSALVGGGKTLRERNVISGNIEYGLELFNTAETTVQGTDIGTDARGEKCLGNGFEFPHAFSGLYVFTGGSTLIGGTAPMAYNVISCNADVGLWAQYDFVDDPAFSPWALQVQGNYIGTNGKLAIPAGTLHMGNGDDGVLIEFDGAPNGPTLVGGPMAGQPNSIAFNRVDGVGMCCGSQVALLHNPIYQNAMLGIDNGNNQLVDCPTSADSNTAATCPVITAATTALVKGTGNPGDTVEVFVATNELDDKNPSDGFIYGEGKPFLASTVVGADGKWSVAIPAGKLTSGQWVTADAITPSSGGYRETSEFTRNVRVS